MKDGDFIYKDSLLRKLIKLKEYNFNSQYGGFKKAPKSPEFLDLYSLMKIALVKDSQILQKMIEKTLVSIYKGGIFDHVGYGFYSYTNDDKWLIPSFQKTLFDNASAILAYSLTFKITRNDIYKNIAYETLSYVDKTLLSSSEYYYLSENDNYKTSSESLTFSYDEIFSILKEDALLFSIYYDITEEGNFKGRNILNLIDRDLELNEFFNDKNLKIKGKLLNYRLSKFSTNIDKKISISANGLMIAALAYSGNSFKDKYLISKAEATIDFILKKFYIGNELYKEYISSTNFIKASLDEYAFLIFGLLEYYKVSKSPYYLKVLINLTNYTLENFYSNKVFSFIDFNIDSKITSNEKLFLDSINPTLNSIMILNLINLSKIKREDCYSDIIEITLKNIYPLLIKNPEDYSSMIFNFLYWHNINN